MKRMGSPAATFAFAIVSATTAMAAPGGPIHTTTNEGLVTKAATFVCERDERGWRYMRGERRVTCRPARPSGRDWGWRCEGPRCGWWHRHERRWND
jgi:hypothetical protein